MSNIKVGQIWKDYDIRFRQHYAVFKKIINLTETHAYCESYKIVEGEKKIIRKTKIRLDRFKPNATGYLLVEDV